MVGDVIKIVQSQDDQRESLSRERESMRERGRHVYGERRERRSPSIFELSTLTCSTHQSVSESQQKLIRKSLLSFSKPFLKVFTKVGCHRMRQFGQAFPACWKRSEQQIERLWK